MRRTPQLGSLEDLLDDEENVRPRPGTRPERARFDADDASGPSGQPRRTREAGRSGVAGRRPEDTVSLDGMTIDELLAQSDAPLPDPDELNGSRDDTGEWDAIEDMLDPEVMLREGNARK